jgi:hypothetical protein
MPRALDEYANLERTQRAMLADVQPLSACERTPSTWAGLRDTVLANCHHVVTEVDFYGSLVSL